MIEVRSLSPCAAAQMLHDEPQAILIDVRSSMEFLFVGHPLGAMNIPWIDEPDWEINPEFVAAVRRFVLKNNLNKDIYSVPLLLICRSGVRSMEAGKQLIEDGFHHVYNVLEGFEGELDDQRQRGNLGGWRYHGLAWEQC